MEVICNNCHKEYNNKEKYRISNLKSTNTKLLNNSLKLDSKNLTNINDLNIPIEEKNLMYILLHNHIDFQYENISYQLSNGKLLIPKFYLPLEDQYYCLSFTVTRNYINKIKEYMHENIKFKCIFITKAIYNDLIIQYHFIKELNIPDYLQYILTNEIDRKCIYCGKKLGKKNKRFCSIECYNKSKYHLHEKICVNCNKKFKVHKADLNFSYFCSEECEKEYLDKINTFQCKDYIIENNVKKRFMHNQCDYCHKEIYYFGARKHSYCSNDCKCKMNIKNTKIKHICPECHKEFINHRKEQKFCSVSCSSKYNARKNKFGSNIRPDVIWNAGLSAKTDKRIANMTKHRVNTILNNMKVGKVNNNGYYAGYYKDIGHCVRSGWEHNFARILQYLGLDYDYEEHTFTLSNNKIYIPDFYVYVNKTFYEIKGEWKNDSESKVELFIEEFPQYKLEIIDKKRYYKLINVFKNIVPFNINDHTIDSGFKNGTNTKYRNDKINDKYLSLFMNK